MVANLKALELDDRLAYHGPADFFTDEADVPAVIQIAAKANVGAAAPLLSCPVIKE